MTRLSERARLLKEIDELIRALATFESRYDLKSVNRTQDSIDELLEIMAVLHSTRYFHSRRQLIKHMGALQILPYLQVDEFIQEMRVSQETFGFILSEIENHPVFHNDSQKPQREVWIQLSCALDRLGHFGNGASIGKIARSKGVSYGSMAGYTKRVIHALASMASKYIQWPDEAERSRLSDFNKNQYGFDGCILSTDGTHVVFSQRPGLDGSTYFNRKSRYSMNVMLTFDHNRSIRFVISGWPGSVHDTVVWESGPVLKHPEVFFSEGQYQFGDSGFRLTKHMIIPYRQPEASSPENEHFNLRLSQGRVVSEHGNGILKARWQSLRGLNMNINKPSDVSFACDWVLACCVLHNMVNQRRLMEDEMQPYQDQSSENMTQNACHADQDLETSLSARQWRKAIQSKVLEHWQ